MVIWCLLRYWEFGNGCFAVFGRMAASLHQTTTWAWSSPLHWFDSRNGGKEV
jgi:hypothetical protein